MKIKENVKQITHSFNSNKQTTSPSFSSFIIRTMYKGLTRSTSTSSSAPCYHHLGFFRHLSTKNNVNNNNVRTSSSLALYNSIPNNKNSNNLPLLYNHSNALLLPCKIAAIPSRLKATSSSSSTHGRPTATPTANAPLDRVGENYRIPPHACDVCGRDSDVRRTHTQTKQVN